MTAKKIYSQSSSPSRRWKSMARKGYWNRPPNGDHKGNIDTVARFRKPSLSDTESGKAMDNGVVESEDVEERFSELEHRIAAEFAKHAGRKTVKLEDLKLARTMAGLLTGPLF
ncbi:hypothetical protein BKA65DRAFT_598587 [Rhexocercosporidium sp. MPI-PUGE-AT-0058]|nr:hypothetical protein BKA65DRAFT_598587 [Rhexocercosporidium sp. MPI-PUGE-AT-0058]